MLFDTVSPPATGRNAAGLFQTTLRFSAAFPLAIYIPHSLFPYAANRSNCCKSLPVVITPRLFPVVRMFSYRFPVAVPFTYNPYCPPRNVKSFTSTQFPAISSTFHVVFPGFSSAPFELPRNTIGFPSSPESVALHTVVALSP